MPSTHQTERADSPKRKPAPRAIIAAVLVVLLVVFAAANSQTVTIHWIVTTSQSPLIVVIVGCGIAGFATGWLVARRTARRRAP